MIGATPPIAHEDTTYELEPGALILLEPILVEGLNGVMAVS